MDNLGVNSINALPSEIIILEASQVAKIGQELTESRRLNDLLQDKINALELQNKVILERLNELESFTSERFGQDRQRIAKLERIPAKPGKKSDQRKTTLANILLSRQNQGMTFSEIGKFLELGSRKNGKSTREQNMTHFGKLLEADKKSFVVTDGKTSGGKLVKLTKIYYEHLLRGES